ncbi:MAG: O-antigen ligase family protein [Hassallia sp.]
MLNNQGSRRAFRLMLLISLAGAVVGVIVGFAAGVQPFYVGAALGGIAAIICFFSFFEQAVLGLLILRSALDPFSGQQLPAVFAIGLDALTILYVTLMLLTGQTVRTNKFWWLFAAWVALQGLWVILLPLGGLGLNAAFLSDSIREWVRIFSWLMVYLIVMQLKDRLHPEKIVSALLLALIFPLTIALMQTVLPPSLLPSIFVFGGGDQVSFEKASRINGTLGHPNTFATFLLLFIGLTWWKLSHSKQRWHWLILLGLLAFFYVSTKALFSLLMLAVFVLVLISPKLNIIKLLGGLVFLAIVIGLFASTEFGQERLASIANTPLLNPDIDISRAILLSKGDNNSFNWRLSQWYMLLKAWQEYPILGYGLGLSKQVAGNGFLPHNDYIRTLVEQGIVGMVSFIAFFLAQIVRLISLIKDTPSGTAQHDFCLTLLAVFLAIFVGMITENIWTHTTLFFYWWTVSAVADWNWNKLQPQTPLFTKPY